MNRLADAFALLLVAAWAGGLWAIGYLAAPALFYSLDDKALAGALAGRMFTWIAYVGLFSGFYLLVYRIVRDGAGALKQPFVWIVCAMLLLALAGHFGIQPILAQLKLQAGATDVMQSVFADRFRTWHGVASIAYLLQSLLGAALVLRAR